MTAQLQAATAELQFTGLVAEEDPPGYAETAVQRPVAKVVAEALGPACQDKMLPSKATTCTPSAEWAVRLRRPTVGVVVAAAPTWTRALRTSSASSSDGNTCVGPMASR